ncbi:MAG: hypothetical protein PF549_05095, partial [Patescibacteria group bacterium]|nr:hypothetical protein [Patescibacteria group bacterium]
MKKDEKINLFFIAIATSLNAILTITSIQLLLSDHFKIFGIFQIIFVTMIFGLTIFFLTKNQGESKKNSVGTQNNLLLKSYTLIIIFTLTLAMVDIVDNSRKLLLDQPGKFPINLAIFFLISLVIIYSRKIISADKKYFRYLLVFLGLFLSQTINAFHFGEKLSQVNMANIEIIFSSFSVFPIWLLGLT